MAGNRQNLVLGTLLTALLVLANLVVFNVIMRNVTLRYDLTEDKRHEIGEGTANILGKLEDTVSVKCYFSSNIPKRLYQIERVTIEKLEEYERLSEGRLFFEFVDPESDEVAVQELKDMGIAAVQVEEFESSTTTKMVTCYMAMVFRYGDRKTTLNVFRDMQHRLSDAGEFSSSLEYYISSNIQKVSTERRTVGVLAKIQEVPATQNPQGPKRKYQGIDNLKAWLERHYDVLLVDPDQVNRGEPVPAAVDTLIVYRPEGYNEAGRFVLDQFLMHGGNVLFLVDAGRVDYEPKSKKTMLDRQQVQDYELPTYSGVVVDHGIGELLEHYGVRVEPEFVEDHSCLKFQYVRDKQLSQNPFTRQLVARLIADVDDYYAWPLIPARDEDGKVIDAGQLNPDRAMVSGLKGLVFTWASPLTTLDEKLALHEGSVDVLVRSGPSSWSRAIVDDNGFTSHPEKRYDSDERAPKSLSLLVTGRFRSLFKGREIPAVDAAGQPLAIAEELANSRLDRREDEGTIFVCGDGDFVSDGVLRGIMQMEFQKSRNRELAQSKPRASLSFVNHAVDVLTYGGDAGDLLAIKNSRVRSRELVSMDDDDSRKDTIRIVNMAVMPALVVLLGLIRMFLRASRNRSQERPALETSGAQEVSQ